MSEPRDKALVEALYRVFLGREPEPDGLDLHVRGLAAGATVEDLITGFVRSAEFDGYLPRFADRFDLHRGRLTLDASQFGETHMLIGAMLAKAAPGGLVVEVGVCGRNGSNSYDLMRYFGWRGILIEANPDLRESIAREFEGCDFTYIDCAVGDHDGEGTLTLAQHDAMSSLIQSQAEFFGPTRGSVAVKVRRLAGLLEEAGAPHDFDVLSLDIEGMDGRVLNDLIENSPYRPTWIIVEGREQTLRHGIDGDALSQAVWDAYEVIGVTFANHILQRR